MGDPVPLGQAEHPRPVEPATGGHVEILDGGALVEPSGFESTLEAGGLPRGPLLVDEQTEALLEREFGVLGALHLDRKAGAKAVELHGREFVKQWLGEHRLSF